MPRPEITQVYSIETAEGRRQVIQLSQTLNTLDRANERVDDSMAKVARQSDRASAGFLDYGSSSRKLLRNIAGIGLTLATVGGVFRAIGAPIQKSIQNFREFELAVAEIGTLLLKTPDQLGDVSNALDRVSLAFGVDQIDAARAYYQIVSAGATSAAEAQGILEVAVKASIAGITSLETAADTITTVLNAYKLEASEAGAVSDFLFQTIRDGKTRFEDLSASLGQVVTFAANTGVSMHELGAAIAEITKRGVPTAEAITQIRSLLQSVIKPSERAKKTAEELGIEWTDAALKSQGLVEFLRRMEIVTEGNVSTQARLIGRVEGLNASMVLASGGVSDFEQAVKRQSEATGVSEEALASVTNTLDLSIKQLQQAFKVSSTGFGEMASESTGLSHIMDRLSHNITILATRAGAIDISALSLTQQMSRLRKVADDVTVSSENLIGRWDPLAVAANRFALDLDKVVNKNYEFNESLLDNAYSLTKSEEGLQIVLDVQKEYADEAEELASSTDELSDSELKRLANLLSVVDTLQVAVRWSELREQSQLDEAEAASILAEETERNNKLAEEQIAFEAELVKVEREAADAYNELTSASDKLLDNINRLDEAEKAHLETVERLKYLFEIGYIPTRRQYNIEVARSKKVVDDIRASQDALIDTNSRQDSQTRSLVAGINRINTQYLKSTGLVGELRLAEKGRVEALEQIEEAQKRNIESLIDYDTLTEHLNTTKFDNIRLLGRQYSSAEQYSEALNKLGDETEALEELERDYTAVQTELNEAFEDGEIDAKVLAEVLQLLKERFEALKGTIEETEEESKGFFKRLKDGAKEGYENLKDAIEADGADILLDAIDGDRASIERAFEQMGGDFGRTLGTAMAGPIGGIIGEVIGNKLGQELFNIVDRAVSAIDDAFFSGKDRVTVGVNATSSLFDQLAAGPSQRAASGLLLTPQARGAGDDGRRAANRLLQTLLDADEALVEFLKALGIIVDFTNTELEPDRPRSGLRPSEFHNPFGSVAEDAINQGDLDTAADRFIQEWIDALIESYGDQLDPETVAQLSGIETLTELYEFLGVEAAKASLAVSSSTQAMLDQLYPLEAIERQRTETIARLDQELRDGLITQEQYNALVGLTNETAQEAVDSVNQVEQALTEVSSTTQSLLDELYPLEAIERRRLETIAQLDKELEAGLINQEQYNTLVGHVNQTAQDSVDALSEVEEVIVELSDSTQSLLDQLYPVKALERERAETLARLKEELDANVITQEEYDAALKLVNDTIDAQIAGLNTLSDATQSLLDELFPLEKLERDRVATLERLEKELADELISQEQYNAAVAHVNQTAADAAETIFEQSEAVQTLAKTIEAEIISTTQTRIDALEVERLANEKLIATLVEGLSNLTAVEESILGLLSGGSVLEVGRNLSVFGDATRTLAARYEAATTRLRELASGTLDTVSAWQTLEKAMVDQRAIAIELAKAWFDLSASVETTLLGLADALDFSALSPEEQQAERQRRLGEFERQLGLATTPEEFAQISSDYAKTIQDIVNSATVTAGDPAEFEAQRQRDLAGLWSDPSITSWDEYLKRQAEINARVFNEAFSANAFGQTFTGATAEDVQAQIATFASGLLQAFNTLVQGEIGDETETLGDSEDTLAEEVKTLPEQIAELQQQLITDQTTLVERQEVIVSEQEILTQTQKEAAETALEAAKQQLTNAETDGQTAKQNARTAKQNDTSSKLIGRSANDMHTASVIMDRAGSDMVTAANTPVRVIVTTRSSEVNS